MFHTVNDLIHARAADLGDTPFIRQLDGQTATLPDLIDRGLRVAGALETAGCIRGTRVALVLDDDWILCAAAAFGVWFAGGTVVVFTRTWPQPLFDHLAHTIRPTITLASHPETVNSMDTVVDVAAALTSTPLAKIADVAPNDLAMIAFTSGSSGMPKPVACPHGSFDEDRPVLPWRDGMTFFNNGPAISFVTELMVHGLVNGFGFLVAPGVFGVDVASAIERMQAPTLMIDPQTIRTLATDCPNADLSCVRDIFTGGTHVPPGVLKAIFRRLPGVRVTVMFSTAESSPAGISLDVDVAAVPDDGILAYKPAGDVAVTIRADDGSELGPDERGEIWVKQVTVHRRFYLDRDWDAYMYPDGWVRTGDIGYRDETGAMFVLDRRKDFVLCASGSVSSQMVETILLRHPQVLDVAVFGVTTDDVVEQCWAAVVSQVPVELAALQAHVHSAGGPESLLDGTISVGWIPRNVRGKPLKYQIRAWVERPGADGRPAWVDPIWKV